MELSIAGNLYTISGAALTAHIINPAQPIPSVNGFLRSGLFWNIDVDVRDEWINFWSYGFQFSNVQRWGDVVGQTISRSTPRNEITGEMDRGWYGGNLISGHLEILEAELRFTQREGCKLRLLWQGVCSAAPLECEPETDERLPFSIDCWCVFEHLSCREREHASRLLELEDFTEEVIDSRQNSSVKTFLFKPRC